MIRVGNESQGHMSRLRVRVRINKNGKAVGLTSILGSLFSKSCAFAGAYR